jgi:hypothetical protein
MKFLYLACIAILLSACNKTPQLELTVKADGIDNGVVIFRQASEDVLTQSIKKGEMSVTRQLAAPGYYNMTIMNNDNAIKSKISFDVYLENGTYTFQTDAAHPADYPKVTTTSATQNQLSDYYQLSYQKAGALDRRIDSAKTFLGSDQAAALPAKQRSEMYADTRVLQKQRRDLDLAILTAYIQKHPDNKIGAHIMAQQAFWENPKEYNSIFQKFSAEEKGSDDGLKISNRLNALIGTMADALAPDIIGNTPEGKPFNKMAVKNRITLVEFWRSQNNVSIIDHQKMVNGLILTPADRKKFGIVSVSLDASAEPWKKEIKQDQLAWLQVSDLKGDASPNTRNWNITKLPTYFLVDSNWKIIKADVPLFEVDTEVHEYLRKNP